MTLPSNLWGKAGTSLFFTGFSLFVLPEIGYYVVLVGLAFSVLAFCTYTVELLKQIKRHHVGQPVLTTHWQPR